MSTLRRWIARLVGSFAAVAVGSLALAIAANTTVFALTDAVFLKTLPVPDADQLVLFEWVGPEEAVSEGTF